MTAPSPRNRRIAGSKHQVIRVVQNDLRSRLGNLVRPKTFHTRLGANRHKRRRIKTLRAGFPPGPIAHHSHCKWLQPQTEAVRSLPILRGSVENLFSFGVNECRAFWLILSKIRSTSSSLARPRFEGILALAFWRLGSGSVRWWDPPCPKSQRTRADGGGDE